MRPPSDFTEKSFLGLVFGLEYESEVIFSIWGIFNKICQLYQDLKKSIFALFHFISSFLGCLFGLFASGFAKQSLPLTWGVVQHMFA